MRHFFLSFFTLHQKRNINFYHSVSVHQVINHKKKYIKKKHYCRTLFTYFVLISLYYKKWNLLLIQFSAMFYQILYIVKAVGGMEFVYLFFVKQVNAFCRLGIQLEIKLTIISGLHCAPQSPNF